METRRIVVTCYLFLVSMLSVITAAWGSEPPRLSAQIEELVSQLDDSSFRVRQRASRQLLRIGKPALEALRDSTRHPSAEVRQRAKILIELIQRFELYTVSRDGRLFRLEIAKNQVKTRLVAKLGAPFDKRNVRTEGLAVAPDGSLYASVVFASDAGKVSRLYQLSLMTGSAKLIGDMITTEVDGLDFGPDGKLYGAISSGSRTLARGLRQIVTIDTNSGVVSPTANEVTFADLDALAIDSKGLALVTNGSRGMFSINPAQKRDLSHVFVNDAFRQFLRDNDEMEGLCITREGVVFGLCDEERTFLVRLDQQAKRVTRIGDLGFGALCLAAKKFGKAHSVRESRRAGIQESTPQARRQDAHAESLEGTWDVIFREGIGGDLATIMLTRGKFRLIYESGAEFEGRYIIRNSTTQRLAIDIVHPDRRTGYIIARIEGNTLTWCGSDNPRARPPEFVANEDDGRFFFILRRAEARTKSKVWRVP